MSRRKTPKQPHRVRVEVPEEERRVDAVALLRGGGGHSIVKLSLPLSLVERYAVETEPPEVRAIVAGKLVQWVESVP